MSQQINLFNPIFLKQKKYFSATTLIQALGLILLGSIVVVAYASYQLSRLKDEAQSTATQLASIQVELNKVNVEYAPRQKSKSLEEEIQKITTELKSHQQVFDFLQKGELGNTKGYSEYLRAFSHQIVDGLWLTGLSIVGAGNEIGLQGRTLQPELVPAYINRLKQEPVMQGKSFATLEMQVPQVEQTNQANKDGQPNVKQRVSAGYIEFNLQSSGINKEQTDLAGAKSK